MPYSDEDWGGWVKPVERKNWNLAEDLLFFDKKALDVEPRLSLLESVEEDLNNMGVRNWRCNSQDWIEWRTILEEDKVHQEL